LLTNASVSFNNDILLVRNEKPLSSDDISLADNTNELFNNYSSFVNAKIALSSNDIPF